MSIQQQAIQQCKKYIHSQQKQLYCLKITFVCINMFNHQRPWDQIFSTWACSQNVCSKLSIDEISSILLQAWTTSESFFVSVSSLCISLCQAHVCTQHIYNHVHTLTLTQIHTHTHTHTHTCPEQLIHYWLTVCHIKCWNIVLYSLLKLKVQSVRAEQFCGGLCSYLKTKSKSNCFAHKVKCLDLPSLKGRLDIDFCLKYNMSILIYEKK